MFGRPRHRWKDNIETAVAERFGVWTGFNWCQTEKNGKIL